MMCTQLINLYNEVMMSRYLDCCIDHLIKTR